MPKYIAIINGNEISIESDGANLIGFVTTRVITANNEADAIKLAICQVEEQWRTDDWSKINKSGPPNFSCEEIRRLGFVESFFKRSLKGYTFYSYE